MKGVTLKHAFDHLASYPSSIPCAEGSPATEQESLYFKYCEAGSNINLKPSPETYPLLPDIWYDWTRPMTAKELQEFPLQANYEIDLEHVAKDPVPMQPKKTSNLNKFQTFFISPRKVRNYLVSWGRNYTCCDRFNGEHRITLT